MRCKSMAPLIVIGFSMLTATVYAQSLRWLEPLPTHESSWAYGTSADGSTVVGFSYDADAPGGLMQAVRWTTVGVQDLGSLGSPHSIAYAASANGQVVVGTGSDSPTFDKAFRWTPSTGMQNLGTLGGLVSWGEAVSANGSVVVGASSIPGGGIRAFRWTSSTGMENLGTLGGGMSWAYGVNADGTLTLREEVRQ